jgi:IS30 family transposase
LYRRVTHEDRIKIDAFLASGLNRSQIARHLGFHKSTISREMTRNLYAGRYVPIKAEAKARERYKKCRRRTKLTFELIELVKKKLQNDWSPEQIAGRLRLEKKTTTISHEAIYKLLRLHPELGSNHLRHYGRRGGGRYAQRNGKSKLFLRIAERPKIVAKRSRFGDWERDGMYGANRNQLLVMAERKSRYTLINPMGHGEPKKVTTMTEQMIRPLPIKFHSMTNDRGAENRDSLNLGVPVYFCDIQKPQQKGTIENTIGLLRQYIKRTTNLDSLTSEDIKKIENQLNTRPRKILNYKTPYEVLFKTKVALAS